MGLSLTRIRLSQARPEIQIPMDLVTEILARLPAKSLMRFNCVSKVWSCLIRSQYLRNRFLMIPSQRLYILLRNPNDHSDTLILSSSPDATTTSFVVNQDLTIPFMEFYNMQNIHGFMCSTYSTTMPRMYNPTTRQILTLPTIDSDSPEDRRCYYLGHDPVNDQYKVICSMKTSLGPWRAKSEYWVLDLKPGGSWKKVAPASADFCRIVPVRKPGLSINGVIYSLGVTDDTYEYVVVSFDIGSEEFRTIKMPRIKSVIECSSLIEYGGNLTVFDTTNLTDEGKVHLWVLEDVVGNKEWSRKTLVLKPCQLHLVDTIYLLVNGTTQSGKVLLVPYDFLSPFNILCYDLQSNDMRKIEIKGIPDQWFSKGRFVRVDLMFMESILYLEL